MTTYNEVFVKKKLAENADLKAENFSLKAENDLLNEKLHQADIDYYKMKAELETKNEVLRKAIEEALALFRENENNKQSFVILKKALAGKEGE